MSDLNQKHNRFVWADIPVADLDRAKRFYEGVLAVAAPKESYEGFEFCVLEHDEGNGGCLVVNPDEVARDSGVLVYLNVDGRIRDAVARVKSLGGEVVQDVHAIGPHGCRAVIRDSEGNRMALHSSMDG